MKIEGGIGLIVCSTADEVKGMLFGVTLRGVIIQEGSTASEYECPRLLVMKFCSHLGRQVILKLGRCSRVSSIELVVLPKKNGSKKP